MALGKNVRTLRDKLKWTLEELSKASGVPVGTISAIETRDSVRSKYAGKLATGFGVDVLILTDHEISPDYELPTAIIRATPSNQAQTATNVIANADDAGTPRHFRRTPVVGTAKMGDGGYYEALDYPTGQGDGWVDSYSPDPNAYALRVKGDSMHPAIRHGSFVVVEPNGRCVPGEFVAIVLRDGRKMVKELVIEREQEIVIESVNGNQRQTLERSEIEKMHPIAAVVAASRWRQG